MSVPSVQICEVGIDGAKVRELISGALPQEPPMRTVYLGRNKAPDVVMQKLVRFVDYLGDVPAPPASKSWVNDAAKASIKLVYGNDQYGDCVIASAFHGIGVSSAQESGAAILGTTSEAVNEYHRICGPGDNGCYIPDVKSAMLTGITIGGTKRKIVGFAAVDPASKLGVQTAILVSGGGFNIGFNVPAEWMGSAAYDGAVWDIPRRFSFVGGHDVRAVGYDEKGVQFATWGFVVTITWACMADSRIVDEAYVEFQNDWDVVEPSPSGLNTEQLKAAIAAYNAGHVPDWKPPVDPTPPGPTPVPPAPPPGPTPPPAPIVFPNYAGTLQFHLPILGNIAGTMVMAPTTEKTQLPSPDEGGSFAKLLASASALGFSFSDLWKIAQHALAIWSAIKSDQALKDAVNALLADFGIAPLLLDKTARMVMNKSAVNYFVILADVFAIVVAARTYGVTSPQVIAAVTKLAADLGWTL